MRGEFVEVGGARLYYYAAGTRGAGVPVVLLHGFPTSAHVWQDLVPLMPAGHRVVVLDLLGYGRSDRPDGRDVSFAGHADRVVGFMDVLGISEACIVGHDAGGAIAQSMALRHPTRVSHLGLVSSLAFDAWPTLSGRLARKLARFARNLSPGFLCDLVRSTLATGYVNSDRAAHSTHLFVRPFAGVEGRAALLEHIAALRPAETRAIGERLGEIRVPTTVVWGLKDPFFSPRASARLQRAIPGASSCAIPDQRHFTPEEAPEQIAGEIAALLARRATT